MPCLSRLFLGASSLILTSTLVVAQPAYRVVTPDGKVLYTDRPPASSKARVTELQPADPRAGAPAGAKKGSGAARGARSEVKVDFARHRADAAQTQYRACVASRTREVRLATLSGELVENRNSLLMAEKIQAEKLRDPKIAADIRDSDEWRRLAEMEPAQLRAALGQQFAEYRRVGGPAARVEDVQLIANPCAEPLRGK